MAYKCVHCSKIFEDGSKEVLVGCSKCNSKFFFFIKKEKLAEIQKMQKVEEELTDTEKKQIEEDVRDIVGIENEETPVFLDFESIKILKSGKYLLDLPKLFARDKPRIYELERGKYVVDFSARILDSENQ
tara:strand:+ start:590 stop:979 length:390 start_codon:yes stop_codon:yes gene_type:complete